MLSAIKIAVLALLLSSTYEHKCIHSEIIKKRGPIVFGDHASISSNAPMARLLQSWTWRTPVIVTDYSKSTISGSGLTAIQKLMETHVLPRIQMSFQVQGNTVISKFSTTQCDNLIKVPSRFWTSDTTADLILMVTTVNDSDDYLAYASACQVDQVTGRPNIGMIAINLRYTNLTNLQAETTTYTLLHEIHHILIMSPDLWVNFYKSNSATTKNVTVSTKSGKTTQIMVISPSVVSYGKTYFSCSSFQGIPMENEGGSGSAGTHWEKLYLGNEIMTSQMTGKPVYSAFTFALMQDSGWYNVDTSKAEPLLWGRGQGCSFLDSTCNTQYSEFCNKPTSGLASSYYYCSRDFTSRTYCASTSFTDTCYIKEYMKNDNCNQADPDFQSATLYEKPGPNSRCFITNYNSRNLPGCYPSSCSNGQITITVNGQQLTCSSAGAVLSVGSLQVLCPDPSTFCTYLSQGCSNDCSGHGKCMNGGCFCDLFWTGSDCSTSSACSFGSDVCALFGVGSSSNPNNNNPFGFTSILNSIASAFLFGFLLSMS